jgi:multidrug efflux pump subunit AcrB
VQPEGIAMWIVRLALNRPYTFVVLAILILLLSPAVILRTPTDIFPNIDIPVISVAWTYTGLNPEDLETRLTTPFEKILTSLVDNIQHIESSTSAPPAFRFSSLDFRGRECQNSN